MYSLARSNKASPFGAAAHPEAKQRKNMPLQARFVDQRPGTHAAKVVQTGVVAPDLTGLLQNLLLPSVRTGQSRQAISVFSEAMTSLAKSGNVNARYATWTNVSVPYLLKQVLTDGGSREEFKLALQQKRSALQATIDRALSQESIELRSKIRNKTDNAMGALLSQLQGPAPTFQKAARSREAISKIPD